MIAQSTRRSGHRMKAKPRKINRSNRAVFADMVVQVLRQQHHLMTIYALDKLPH